MDRNVLVLLALFALGSPLFHMPGFFFIDSPLNALGIVAILHPFLVTIAVGIYASVSERRAVLLVGLLLVIPIGAFSRSTP